MQLSSSTKLVNKHINSNYAFCVHARSRLVHNITNSGACQKAHWSIELGQQTIETYISTWWMASSICCQLTSFVYYGGSLRRWNFAGYHVIMMDICNHITRVYKIGSAFLTLCWCKQQRIVMVVVDFYQFLLLYDAWLALLLVIKLLALFGNCSIVFVYKKCERLKSQQEMMFWRYFKRSDASQWKEHDWKHCLQEF